jgi:hypothetical protein
MENKVVERSGDKIVLVRVLPWERSVQMRVNEV